MHDVRRHESLVLENPNFGDIKTRALFFEKVIFLYKSMRYCFFLKIFWGMEFFFNDVDKTQQAALEIGISADVQIAELAY
jgi:hypothetical protein